MSLFLLQIAAEVAAPLAKTEEIVLIGGNDNVTNDVSRLVAQLPPSINALTGVDLSKVLSKIPGAKAWDLAHLSAPGFDDLAMAWILN